jgi:hypothetical protein
MNASNGTDEPNITETNDITNKKVLTSSPPSSPPSAEPIDAALDDSHTSSSPDRKPDTDEQPVIIAPEFLPTVIALLEALGPRRVKVYELRGEVWVDLGTGFCRGFVENVFSLPFSNRVAYISSRALHISG